MSERPTGTVTFLFTDIEGSTQLLHELGGEYRTALDDHRRLLREAFAAHAGHEVDTQGDAFFAAFHRARDAVHAAGDAQRALAAHTWPSGRNVRVRMGIHTCEAPATSEGYVGVGVHRGARICSAAHGGQVLVSHTSRELLLEEDAGLVLRDLGEHRLKDMTEAQRLYQLAEDGLAMDFPPPRTLENRPTNLPVQPTALVGRDRELVELVALLRRDRVRLVTLTGPGGTGKTRLGLQAAADLLEAFPNGVFVAALAAIVDHELVIPTIAQTFGINETGGQSLDGYLAEKELLLVVDNFEQVLPAATAVAELLRGAPKVRVIATSREPLHVAAEHVFPVGPLGLPDPAHLPSLAALSQYDAVALFVERARAVQPSFEITTENAPAVAEICVRLDGLPLALELAAARIPLLSPEAMLKRLDERLSLLTAGARDLPVRHQTLRRTIEWSHELLDEHERDLFAKLGVFAGGFSLEAAEAVCAANLDALASLVDKSLTRREGDRFTMLQTIREYAVERLANRPDDDDARTRHAQYFLDLAEEAYTQRIEHEAEWAEKLENEHDNLRAALDWMKAQDADRELQLAGALGWFWFSRSHLAEGRALLGGALDHEARDDRLQARAFAAAGALAAWQGDIQAAAALLQPAVALWDALGEPVEQALALESLGWGYFFAGDDPSARTNFERSLELQREGADPRLVNRAQLGVCQILVSQGDLEPAERLAREALALAEEQDDPWARHLAHHFLADCALISEDFESAEERYTRSLRAAIALGNRSEQSIELQGVAMAAAGRGHAERALRLAAAADKAYSDLGIDISGVAFWIALLEKNLGPAKSALGAGAAVLEEEGARLSLDEAVAEALAVESA
jgi:predicted ATPase/class 3 adenylate cyclase